MNGVIERLYSVHCARCGAQEPADYPTKRAFARALGKWGWDVVLEGWVCRDCARRTHPPKEVPRGRD